ncbi:hypothetical protein PT974_04055 [Cladobotryum mycophilum]|uniref:Galectin n=1 Tax=Cladobotryum mycophilum TaxID=491253 RepID=A0ABR0SV49_9HYPO
MPVPLLGTLDTPRISYDNIKIITHLDVEDHIENVNTMGIVSLRLGCRGGVPFRPGCGARYKRRMPFILTLAEDSDVSIKVNGVLLREGQLWFVKGLPLLNIQDATSLHFVILLLLDELHASRWIFITVAAWNW